MARVIVTGATGLAGSAVIEAALADGDFDEVVVWTRRPAGGSNPRLIERIHRDFTAYDELSADIAASQAILWCLGVAQGQVSRADYERITFDYAVAAARAIARTNPRLRFCFLSGGGADSTERSRVLFARVKGKTENALLAALPDVYCFRPGYIRSTRGPRPGRSLADRGFGLLAPMLARVAPGMIIDDTSLARAMLMVARNGYEQRVLENVALRRLSEAAAQRKNNEQ